MKTAKQARETAERVIIVRNVNEIFKQIDSACEAGKTEVEVSVNRDMRFRVLDILGAYEYNYTTREIKESTVEVTIDWKD